MMQQVQIGKIVIGRPKELVIIAGPCVIESETFCLSMVRRIKAVCENVGFPFIFKASYDKANRLSLDSFRGPGLKKGIEILAKVKQKYGVPILSDVHCKEEIKQVENILDVIQIPAFLCRQTDLVVEAAKTGKVINIKKAQFLAPWDMAGIIKKVEVTANRQILLTERGFCFGYNNLVVDFRSLGILAQFGYPVIFDATHSVQLPGGKGSCSGGQRQFVLPLCRAAVAYGCQGLFLEVHSQPNKALCDGPNMIEPKQLEIILRQVKKIKQCL
ncbi:MAG: 3-deoxy-8-phosphooctulonate synthase [Candidatus Omnitrophica bacterium]|nr:3-deoxy-8-phosphooctulonate synthase [Candidatus Omnitrophota bacterium]